MPLGAGWVCLGFERSEVFSSLSQVTASGGPCAAPSSQRVRVLVPRRPRAATQGAK